jgi:hypothetical protein
MTKKFVRPTKEESAARLAADIAASKKIYDAFIGHDMLDDDGYPTDEAMHIIESWHWTDPKGWFDFINSIWHLKSWGWGEGETNHEYRKDKKVYRYDVSTAGWSGNETIIQYMKRNDMMWHLNWVQSRRGGHYIFELYEFKDDE